MTIQIPKSLKKEFKDGFEEYIKSMGRKIIAHLKPFKVSCPNCIIDNFQNKSSNVYNESFKKPVNIFPATPAERIIYPAPFNVLAVSGVQYDPSIPDPKILDAVFCPVCLGEGILIDENTTCFIGVITVGLRVIGADSSGFTDLSSGRDGRQITRIKTYAKNYPVCRDAEFFTIDGIKYIIEMPAKLKGLGNLSITEFYLSTVEVDSSSNNKYDSDRRILIEEFGQVSDQAPDLTPTSPSSSPGEDVW